MRLPRIKKEQRLAVLALCMATAAGTAWAQPKPQEKKPTPAAPAAAASTPAPAAKSPATPTPAEVAPRPSPLTTPAAEEDVIVLSPFEVVSDNKGYMATNSASGTRLNSRLEDLASPISVVTKQQLQDMAAVDLNDIFRSEANVEGLYQYTELQFDRNNIVDVASNNPEANNRIRGIGQANITSNGMSVSSATPIDAYNVDSVEINRGANSNIFGIGSTSGTVNLNISSGNLSRDLTKFSFMTDDLGRARETFDINRVILRNKLAIRILGAHDKLGFVREPSKSVTKRFTIAARAQPFKKTSIKVSYETYRNESSLPNQLMPREIISQWRAEGSHTWDAATATVYNAAGNPVGTFSGTQIDQVVNGQPVLGSLSLRTLYGFQGGDLSSGNQRPTIGYIDGNVAYFTSTSAWRFNRFTGTPLAPQYIQTGDQRLVDYLIPQQTIYVPETNPATGQPFGYVTSAFNEQLVATTDKSLYDWTSYNINAANRAERRSNVTRIELEQYILQSARQTLAFQVAGLREDVENKSWNFIGNGGDGIQGILRPDVNRTLPNGAPNPGYLRPYVGAMQPQVFYRPEENFTRKAQLAYLIDFTQNDGWSKWLGKHNMLAYAEHRERRFSPSSIRYRSQLPNTTDGFIRHNPGNSDSLNTRYYLGDGSGMNVDDPTTSPPTTGVVPYTYWSTENGSAGTALPLLNPPAWRTTDVRLAEVFFSGRTQKNENRAQGAIWQGFFLNGRIIPTLGYRKDRVRFVGNQRYGPLIGTAERLAISPTDVIASPGTAAPYSVEGYPSTIFHDPTSALFNFNDAYLVTNPRIGANERYGQTRTQGVVVKPLVGLTKYRFLDGVSFTYNRSDSFEPADLAIDAYGDILDDPTGKTEDYGVRFSLLDERLWISINKYKQESVNNRASAASVTAQRAIPFDVDTADANPDNSFIGSNSETQKDLFDWYFFQIFGTTTNTGTGSNPTFIPGFNGTGDINYMTNKGLIGATNTETLQRVTDHVFDLMKYDKEIVRKRNNVPGAGNSATNDVTSKGYELEVLYRTKNFDMKVTGAKKETVDSNIAPSLTKYINERQPILEAASYTHSVTGRTVSFWNTSSSGRTTTRGQDYFSEVYSVYNPLVANLGKPRTQIRKYSVALTTSYRLAGLSSNSIIKNIRVGGGGSWTSKASIGYGYALPIFDPVLNRYEIRLLDPNKPLYDKARYTANAWAAYDFKLMSGRIKSSVQLNVQNLLEDGRLQATHVRTDGQPFSYRIIDPRLFQLTLNFEL